MYRSSNCIRSRAGLVLIILKGVIAKYALCFELPMTNNEGEYEALITRLQVDKKLGVRDLKAYNIS